MRSSQIGLPHLFTYKQSIDVFQLEITIEFNLIVEFLFCALFYEHCIDVIKAWTI